MLVDKFSAILYLSSANYVICKSLFFVFCFIGSGPRAKSNSFFHSFVCGYLAKHVEARHLVKLKEDRSILRFNDIHKISSIYCDYVYEEKGKTLKRDLKSRRDNFLKIMVQLENDGLLKNVGSGKDYDKEYLKYEVKNSEMWHSLTKNYSVQRNTRMVTRIFT